MIADRAGKARDGAKIDAIKQPLTARKVRPITDSACVGPDRIAVELQECGRSESLLESRCEEQVRSC
jgi:hypothetical protein